MIGQNPRLPSLRSGGIMVNYRCPSRCRHCLYCCDPARDNAYLSPEHAGKYARAILEAGCDAVHLGGGEPFLSPDELAAAAAAITDAGVGIDYVETNAAWCVDQGRAVALLRTLQGNGIHTLLVSISPFHNEFIPLSRTLKLMRACAKAGTHVFPWVEGFLPDLEAMGSDIVHSPDEYEATFGAPSGAGYVESIPSRYRVTMRGRALATYRRYMTQAPAESFLDPRPCRELFDTSHFHVDCYGNFIPGLCTGLSVDVADIREEISAERYPRLHALMTRGIEGLYSDALSGGFEPQEGYVSKCDLCQAIRSHFARSSRVSADLAPQEFYERLEP